MKIFVIQNEFIGSLDIEDTNSTFSLHPLFDQMLFFRYHGMPLVCYWQIVVYI